MAGLAGVVAWWFTGESRFLVLPQVPPLGFWAIFRFLTPAEGMVSRKLSASVSPDLARFLWFAPLWFLVAVAGLAAHQAYLSRLANPTAILTVGMIVWFAVLLYEAYRLDRRIAHRDREAAELAAKARGESSADPRRPD